MSILLVSEFAVYFNFQTWGEQVRFDKSEVAAKKSTMARWTMKPMLDIRNSNASVNVSSQNSYDRRKFTQNRRNLTQSNASRTKEKIERVKEYNLVLKYFSPNLREEHMFLIKMILNAM